jgi:CRP-like cAMP-binding protein
MTEFRSSPKEWLYKAGDKIDRVYFIQKGSVSYYTEFVHTKAYQTKYMKFVDGVEHHKRRELCNLRAGQVAGFDELIESYYEGKRNYDKLVRKYSCRVTEDFQGLVLTVPNFLYLLNQIQSRHFIREVIETRNLLLKTQTDTILKVGNIVMSQKVGQDDQKRGSPTSIKESVSSHVQIVSSQVSLGKSRSPTRGIILSSPTTRINSARTE